MSKGSEAKTTAEMLYILKLTERTDFSNKENFKRFIKLSLLERGFLEGRFDVLVTGYDAGRGHIINRQYYINGLSNPLYVEKDIPYENSPCLAEVFGDMKNNLSLWAGEEADTLVSVNGKFLISKKA